MIIIDFIVLNVLMNRPPCSTPSYLFLSPTHRSAVVGHVALCKSNSSEEFAKTDSTDLFGKLIFRTQTLACKNPNLFVEKINLFQKLKLLSSFKEFQEFLKFEFSFKIFHEF